MLRGLSALLLVALLAAPAAGQQVLSDDEFALLGIPRPGAMLAGFGLPQVGGGFSKLLDELTQGDDEVTPNGAENVGGRVTIIGLPPMLSGLFRKSQEQARPTMSMRFRPMFAMPAGPSLSRPLKELSMLANGCEPCSRVQSHMRSMSVMLGPNGQRVETVTEVGGQCTASFTAACRVCCSTFPGCLAAARVGRCRVLILQQPVVAQQPTCLRFETQTKLLLAAKQGVSGFLLLARFSF
jgi:hypothetical protein